MQHNILEGLAQRRSDAVAIAVVHGASQATDAGMTAKTIAFLQQAQAVAQRAGNITFARRYRVAGQPLQLRRSSGGIAGIDPGTNIPEYRSGLHRRQLIAVAEENNPPVFRQGINQPRHHRQVNH